jgi:hypothetical protein
MPNPPKQPVGRPPKRPPWWKAIGQAIRAKKDVLQTPTSNIHARRMRKKQGL